MLYRMPAAESFDNRVGRFADVLVSQITSNILSVINSSEMKRRFVDCENIYGTVVKHAGGELT